uniref:Uncharacterized protein n=1 Tax=Chenopodium quinoa TaxID=63459 RepID=A0A803MKF5_CHEQI
MLSERERYADSSIADSSISCRRNWGGILKKIMKKVLVASSGKQTNKRKLKVVVEDEVVDDVEEDLEDINEVSDGSSEDDDYEEEVEEDDPEDELEGGEYVDEVDYLQHTRSELMLSERERYADSSIADSSISCRRNWGGSLKKIMKKVLVASSGKQTDKRKLKAIVEDEVVDDVEEVLEDINERKRKVVEQENTRATTTTTRSRPVQQLKKRIFRRVKLPTAAKTQFVERSQEVERQYVERPPAVGRQYVERHAPVQRQYVERHALVQRRRIVEEHDDQIDLEPGPSVGEKVKMNGVMSANYNCRVSAFSDLITVLKIDKDKIDLVERCGFGGLLKLKVKKIDRRFWYWLMTRVDHERRLFVGGDGKELPLGPEQYRCVFDLPRGLKLVPDMVEDPVMQSKVDDIVRNFGASASEYNWCVCVHSWMLGSVREFHKIFDGKGYVAGGGGCGLFLTVSFPYGERHPWEPRDSADSLELRVANEVLKLLKPYFVKLENMLNASNRGFVRNAHKERSPIRSLVMNDLSISVSIEECDLTSGDVNKGRLEETCRQLEEVVSMTSNDPIGHVLEQVTSAVNETFGTIADEGQNKEVGDLAPSVAAVTEGQHKEVVGDSAPSAAALTEGQHNEVVGDSAPSVAAIKLTCDMDIILSKKHRQPLRGVAASQLAVDGGDVNHGRMQLLIEDLRSVCNEQRNPLDTCEAEFDINSTLYYKKYDDIEVGVVIGEVELRVSLFLSAVYWEPFLGRFMLIPSGPLPLLRTLSQLRSNRKAVSLCFGAKVKFTLWPLKHPDVPGIVHQVVNLSFHGPYGASSTCRRSLKKLLGYPIKGKKTAKNI